MSEVNRTIHDFVRKKLYLGEDQGVVSMATVANGQDALGWVLHRLHELAKDYDDDPEARFKKVLVFGTSHWRQKDKDHAERKLFEIFLGKDILAYDLPLSSLYYRIASKYNLGIEFCKEHYSAELARRDDLHSIMGTVHLNFYYGDNDNAVTELRKFRALAKKERFFVLVRQSYEMGMTEGTIPSLKGAQERMDFLESVKATGCQSNPDLFKEVDYSLLVCRGKEDQYLVEKDS